MRRATILHADLDAFYASVEQRDVPALRGRPVIVGGGVVLAASYEARVCGVRSAMRGGEARDRCPNAIWRSPRMEAYAEASKAVFAIFEDITPLVEPLSVDEAFLDVSGAENLLGDPVTISQHLRQRVAADVGLPLSIGIARTKFLAKVASAQAKPDGVLHVAPTHEAAFLHPLPVEVLWGVGPATAARLHSHGIETVGDLAAAQREQLTSIVGRGIGTHLRALAHHRDPRPVVTNRRDRTMGAQRALGQHRRSVDELHRELLALCDKVARRLRRAERLAHTVTLRYRTADMRALSRSRTLPQPTDDTGVLAATASVLLDNIVDGPQGPGSQLGRDGCSLIGITFSGLCTSDVMQLAMSFPGEGPRRELLDDAMDTIRDRWGNAAVARASLLDHRSDAVVLPRPSALDQPELLT